MQLSYSQYIYFLSEVAMKKLVNEAKKGPHLSKPFFKKLKFVTVYEVKYINNFRHVVVSSSQVDYSLINHYDRDQRSS